MSYIGSTPANKIVTASDIEDGVVSSAKITNATIAVADMAANSIDSDQYVDASIDAAHLNVATITGQTAETSIADGDTILIHDASASALRKMTKANFVSGIGGANTPNFAVYQQSAPGTTLVQNTYTKVVWDSEYYDTNNAFASGRFTVPSGQAGKYFFTSTVSMQASLAEINIDLYLNGSSFWRGAAIHANDNSAQTVTGIIDLSVGNYVEVFVRQNIGTNQVEGGGSHSYFHGFKLI